MRIFRYLLRAVLMLVCLVALVAAFVYWRSDRTLSRRHPGLGNPVTVTTSESAIANGKHVAAIRGCVACHGDDGGGAMVMHDAAMGTVYGPNLTRGLGGVGGSLSSADWERAIRDGVAPDGHGLVIMPSKDFVDLTDQDTADVIAYFQSIHPVDRTVPPISMGPVARGLIAFGKLKLSADVIAHGHRQAEAAIAIGVTPAYGRYLVSSCTGCHNPNLSGGKIVEGPPDWPPAANLTQGPGSGVAGWTEANFVSTIRTMHAPDGRALNPVMPSVFGQMTDTELKALWAYMATVPPRPTGQ